MLSLNATRTTVREKLGKTIGDKDTLEKIEKSIYKYTTQKAKADKIPLLWSNTTLRRIYLRKARSVMYNIDAIDKLMRANKLQPDAVAFSSCYDIRPDIYNPIIDKLKKKEIMTELVDKEDEEEYESLLKCPNCGSTNTRYTMYQCRSGDEASNIFYRCIACGTHDVIRD